jgi:hypothetical protein
MIANAVLGRLVRWNRFRTAGNPDFVGGLRAWSTSVSIPPAQALAEADTAPHPVTPCAALCDDTVLLARVEPVFLRYVGVAASPRVGEPIDPDGWLGED